MNANQVKKWIDEIEMEELVRRENAENNINQNPEDRRVPRWNRRLEGITARMDLLERLEKECENGAGWVENAHNKDVFEGWIASQMHSGDVF